jgi:signal transduction histidine kinase
MYQYMLEGLENTWSVPSPKSEAAYGNLPSGKYVFKAKSRNEDDNWSEELNYSFVIHPPFWKTWWAFLLYFLVFAAGVYYFIQFKVKQKIKKIKELEAMRVRISSNLHDDVGTILSGLAMQSQMMAITAQKEQKGALLELSKMSHEAMERMRDTVWAIDSRKDKYENLIDKMREYVEKNLHLKNIKHTFKVEIEDPKKFIEPEIRQNIYLITKEAIANICKHSDATNVEIKFLQIKNHLELVIMDNGTLLKPINDNGMGLLNMKMRAKKMGATLDHRLDNGCMVRLQMGI